MQTNEVIGDDLRRRIDVLIDRAEVDRTLIARLEQGAVLDQATIASLEFALSTSRRIGTAIGILMSERKIVADAAFALLSQASQDQNRKLRDIADEVVEAGDLL